MHPFWLIIGSVVILMGIFNKPLLYLLGLKPLSEVFTTPNLKHSSRTIERIGRWLVIVLGASFIVQGAGARLPESIGNPLSLALVGLSVLLLLAMFGVAIVNWKAK